MYKERFADKIIEEKLKYTGALEIRGPKWCGKSTTAMQHSKSNVFMQDLNEKDKNVELAKNAPSKFLEGPTPRLIDEWQEIAFIKDQIRYEVDKRNKMGQFILTGSASPVDEDSYSHSGIGRISPMIMRTMSLYESGDSNGGVSISKLFSQDIKLDITCDKNLDDYAYLICRGGWPGIFNVNKKYELKLAENFLDGLVNEDINKVFKNKKNPDRLEKVMRAYSRGIGSQMSLEKMTADIKENEGIQIDAKTVSSYINALKKIYVIEELKSWNQNLRSSTALRTTDTRYFVDPSIATATLKISPEDLINDMKTFGFMFESMCIRDLRSYADLLDGDVFHYRDRNNLEVDAIIHLKNGDWGAIEIKLRSTDGIEEGSSNLLKLKALCMAKKMRPPKFMMVLTAGEYAVKRQDGIYVVPLASLEP